MEVFYVDGQSVGNERRGSARKAKIAFVYQGSPNPDRSTVYWKDVGDKTNNEAEYLALLEALTFIQKKWEPRDGEASESVEIRSDSELIVKQLHGEYKVKEDRLKPMREEARTILAQLGFVRVRWVAREENYAGRWLEGLWTAKTVIKL